MSQKYADALTEERLFGWHAALFPTGRSGMHRITVGGWRDDKAGRMQVISGPVGRERVHYEAPKADRVAHDMEAFLAWFNGGEEIDPVLKAGVAHLWFVTVHPFEDGNGRVARAIADMQLARSEQSPQRFYSMSAQIRQERNAYYKTLEATQKGDLDLTEWLQWFLQCLGRAIDGAEGILGGVLKKARFWETHPANTGLVFYYRGQAYAKTGNLNRAIADYDQAIKIDPGFSAAVIARRNAQGLLKQ